MLILITGDFGVGKDTIADMFVDYLGDEACKIKSWTTRPPRFEGENTHLFCDNELAQSFPVSEMVAYCTIEGYRYWTDFSQFNNKKYEFYVIDIDSVYQVVSKQNRLPPIVIILIKRPNCLIKVEEARLNRKREDDDSYFEHPYVNFNINMVYNNLSSDLEDLNDDVRMMAEMIKHSFE